jgi:hypothetical protein
VVIEPVCSGIIVGDSILMSVVATVPYLFCGNNDKEAAIL